MSEIINKYQVIKYEGKPLFVLVPYDEFLRLVKKEKEPTIPHEVVGFVVKKGWNLLKAWRKYLGLLKKSWQEGWESRNLHFHSWRRGKITAPKPWKNLPEPWV